MIQSTGTGLAKETAELDIQGLPIGLPTSAGLTGPVNHMAGISKTEHIHIHTVPDILE
jgi:hypothetical protein